MGEPAKLAPQSFAPTKSPTPSPAPQPKPKKPTPDQKAGSWVQPNSKPGIQLVGRIFFRTKDSTIDARDRALLAELARAYGGSKDKPVRGTFDGFADPRPSHDPANTDLSHARAEAVARELLYAFARTSAWYENVTAVGRGVDPAAPAKPDKGIEDAHAPYRRVDIYLEGKAEPVAPQKSPNGNDNDNRPRVPDYSDRPRTWRDNHEKKHGYHVERGHKPTIAGMAKRLQIQMTSGQGDGRLNERLFYQGVPVVKPPWWDSRIPAPVHGRGGFRHDQRPEYIRRAMQLMEDYQLYLNYLDDRQGDLRTWDNSGFRDPQTIPDGVQVRERLGHLRFMIDAIGDEAGNVRALVE
jgi:outer membrane protein OmpA-like peptidoglycan-associated protein